MILELVCKFYDLSEYENKTRNSYATFKFKVFIELTN